MTFASDQIDTVLPSLAGKGTFAKENVLALFGLEHVILAVAVLYVAAMDRSPRWVRIFRKRRQHHLVKERKKAALQRRNTEMK